MQVWEGHEPEVWCCHFEFLLDDCDEVFDLLGWSGPEDEAVSRIYVFRVQLMAV